MKRKEEVWTKECITRLEKQKIEKNDTSFQVVYAIGPPKRIVWNNEFEIFIYEDGMALIFEEGLYASEKLCEGCYEKYNDQLSEGFTNEDIIQKLGLKRPKY